MHDHLALDSVDDVSLFPREVVMVLQVQQHLRPKVPGDVFVNARMVRRRVASHQFHRRPVLLPFLGIQRQPGQPLQFAR